MARKKSRGRFIRAFLALLVLIAVCCVAYLYSADKTAAKDLAALKQLGVPTTFEEYRLSLGHEGIDGSKQYDVALKGWEDLVKSSPAIDDAVRYGPGHDPMDAATLKKKTPKKLDTRTSNTLAEVTDQFRQAGATDWTDFTAASDRLPGAEEFQREKALDMGVRLLIRSAIQQGKTGSYNRAFNDIYYASRIAANRSRSAVGIGEMVSALRLQVRVLDGWRVTIQTGQNDPKYVETAGRVLNNMPPLPTIDHILRSEFVADRWINKNLRDFEQSRGVQPPSELKDQLVQDLRRSRIVGIYRHAKAVSSWRKIFENKPSDPNDWKGYVSDIDKNWDTGYVGMLDRDNGLEYRSELDMLLTFWATALAKRRLAETSLAILMTSQQTGRVPTKLPALGDQSIDPFSGKPFIYVPKSGKFILYSVGPDGKDNGGSPAWTNGEQDIVMPNP